VAQRVKADFVLFARDVSAFAGAVMADRQGDLLFEGSVLFFIQRWIYFQWRFTGNFSAPPAARPSFERRRLV
jgi:hypothetical protein